MAHFAELDAENSVLRVIVVHNKELLHNSSESEAKGVAFLQSLYGHPNWKQTSYNGNFRKNYAGIGFSYDAGRDAFIAPRPYPSWTLDEATCRWRAPAPIPSSGGPHRWDEAAQAWVPAAQS